MNQEKLSFKDIMFEESFKKVGDGDAYQLRGPVSANWKIIHKPVCSEKCPFKKPENFCRLFDAKLHKRFGWWVEDLPYKPCSKCLYLIKKLKKYQKYHE